MIKKRSEYNKKCINLLKEKLLHDNTYNNVLNKIEEMQKACNTLRLGQMIDNMRHMEIGGTDIFKCFYNTFIVNLNDNIECDFFYEEPSETFKRWKYRLK